MNRGTPPLVYERPLCLTLLCLILYQVCDGIGTLHTRGLKYEAWTFVAPPFVHIYGTIKMIEIVTFTYFLDQIINSEILFVWNLAYYDE